MEFTIRNRTILRVAPLVHTMPIGGPLSAFEQKPPCHLPSFGNRLPTFFSIAKSRSAQP